MKIKIVLWLIFTGFNFVACAGTKQQMPSKDDNVFFKLSLEEGLKSVNEPLPGINKIRYRISHFASPSDARAAVETKREFLKDHLKQSYDPYYGTPRFSDECLKENSIGNVLEGNGEVSVVSQISTDSNFAVGYCGNDRLLARQTIHYCPKKEILVEFSVIGEKAMKVKLICDPTPSIGIEP